MKRWLALILLVPLALALVAAPVYLIQPFKPQTARALEVGYELKRFAPWATLTAAFASLALVLTIWRRSRRRWAKAFAVLLFLPVAASVWLARQNVYEVMFNPLADASFAPADKVDYVNGDDMVLAVEHGGERAAYPVRLMAYHHVVADAVGGVPLVATY
jgi:thiol:disulfide interchange protein